MNYNISLLSLGLSLLLFFSSLHQPGLQLPDRRILLSDDQPCIHAKEAAQKLPDCNPSAGVYSRVKKGLKEMESLKNYREIVL